MRFKYTHDERQIWVKEVQHTNSDSRWLNRFRSQQGSKLKINLDNSTGLMDEFTSSQTLLYIYYHYVIHLKGCLTAPPSLYATLL